ncbi:MAG: phosphoglucomutase/phosphomannomutase family protein, partial [Verrucomicrobiae bacterium]|nr:phosphoglucomutase/phosphomannomutase family protein [Verrucomicrobiae bacterium]
PVPGTEQKVVIGFDRRFLSDEFAARAAEVFAANGFKVVLTSVASPTPTVSYAVKQMRAVGGVMITASHNPPKFNGFKLKAHYGGSADPAICQGVEIFVDKNPVRHIALADAMKQKRVIVKDLRPQHYAAVKRLVDFKLIARAGIRLAHDALFGSAAGCFEQLLAGTTCKVTTLNAQHDPLFGGLNPEPIEKNYVRSKAFLKKYPHDICVVTDGDGDRVGGMDGHGRYLTTHQIICLILYHLVKNRQGRGRVVKALTTTSMLDKMCAAYGLELLETGVGFKYICAEMLKGDVLLGAEESGGIGFHGHIPERDGLAAGLMLLELLATERVPITRLLGRLEKEFGTHRYGRIDTEFPLEKRAALMEYLKLNPPTHLLGSPVKEVKTFDGVKLVAANTSWLMLRGSGTEPILRIYAEAPTDSEVEKLLRLGVRLTRAV